MKWEWLESSTYVSGVNGRVQHAFPRDITKNSSHFAGNGFSSRVTAACGSHMRHGQVLSARLLGKERWARSPKEKPMAAPRCAECVASIRRGYRKILISRAERKPTRKPKPEGRRRGRPER